MPRVGLVLGAGGTTGRAYHAGVLAALEDGLGWDARDVQIVVGTSAGAIVGAMLRAGASGSEIAVHLRGELVGRDGAAVLDTVGQAPDPPTPRPGFGRPHLAARELLDVLRRPGTLPLAALASCLLPRGRCEVAEHAQWVDEVVDDEWPDQALWVASLQLPSLARVLWGRDWRGSPPIGTAVAASCAVPGYIAPIEHDGHEYVDGGCHSPTNADVLAEEPLDLVVISSPMSASPSVPRKGLDVPLRRYFHRVLRSEVEALECHDVEVVPLEPGRTVLEASSLRPVGATDGLEVIDAAYEQVRRQLREREAAAA